MHTIFLLLLAGSSLIAAAQESADLIIYNGKIATMNRPGEFVQAVAEKNGVITGIGSNSNILAMYKGPATKTIDAKGHTVIPGLNDSHIHIIREGLHYNAELRWDGVLSLQRAMAMLKEQAARTPPGIWIKVTGGWNEFQFAEKRLPTLEEINQAVPDKPVYIMYLYGKAFINKKGLEILQYDSNTVFEGSVVELDEHKMPTGMLYARQTAKAIYATLDKTTQLNHEEKINSTLQFYHELNRFGITSAVDAAGGGLHFPEDYKVAVELAQQNKLTIRTSYYLFAQTKGKELTDYEKWVSETKLNRNDNMLLPNGFIEAGAGENIVASAADFENFLEPPIVLDSSMENDLEPIIRLLVKNRWPFRLHATYGTSIERELTLFEKINRDVPFNGLRWFFDHAETVTDSQLIRIKNLGGGIAIQCRMYYQGELYKKLYGNPTAQVPPIKKMLALKIPVGLGTDATRVSTFNPWRSLHWAITGKTIGGYQFWPAGDRLSRFTALQLYTTGSAWMSGEEKLKGRIAKGQYADMVILSDDYFSVVADSIINIHALLTVVNGNIVYAEGAHAHLAPRAPEIIPAWSPVKWYGGYQDR